MKILDLQEHYLEVLDDVQDKSLIGGISGGAISLFGGVILSGTTGAFLAADFTGRNNTSASISSIATLTGSLNNFTLTIGTKIATITTP